MKPQAHWIYRFFFLSALAVTFYLALTPRPLPLVEDLWDKAKHFAAFLVLAFLATRAFPRANPYFRFCGLLAYGLLIEIVQYFLPYRDASGLDLLADALGLWAWEIILFVRRASASRCA